MECCDKAVKEATKAVRENLGHFGFSVPAAVDSKMHQTILKTLDEVETQWVIIQARKKPKQKILGHLLETATKLKSEQSLTTTETS